MQVNTAILSSSCQDLLTIFRKFPHSAFGVFEDVGAESAGRCSLRIEMTISCLCSVCWRTSRRSSTALATAPSLTPCTMNWQPGNIFSSTAGWEGYRLRMKNRWVLHSKSQLVSNEPLSFGVFFLQWRNKSYDTWTWFAWCQARVLL